MPSAEISMKIKHCWSRVSEGEIALDQGRTNGVRALILLVQACTELIQCSAPHMVDPVRDSQSKVGHFFSQNICSATSFPYLFKNLQTMARDILGISFIIFGNRFLHETAVPWRSQAVAHPGRCSPCFQISKTSPGRRSTFSRLMSG